MSRETTTGSNRVNPLYTNGAAHVSLSSQLAGERNVGTANEYNVSVDECSMTVIDEADGTDIRVSSGVPALLFGVFVNETLAGGTIIIQDDSTAKITLPAGLAAGVMLKIPGAKFDTDLTVNCQAGLSTGNITVFWRPQ